MCLIHVRENVGPTAAPGAYSTILAHLDGDYLVLGGRAPAQYQVGSLPRCVQTIPGPYNVVSLEPVRHDCLSSRLAVMGLTPRQQDIASRVLQGVPSKRIAGELDLTEQTVKDHIYAIFRKLGIHHRAELAARVLPISLDELR